MFNVCLMLSPYFRHFSNKDEIEWELVNKEMERALFQEYFKAERVIGKLRTFTQAFLVAVI